MFRTKSNCAVAKKASWMVLLLGLACTSLASAETPSEQAAQAHANDHDDAEQSARRRQLMRRASSYLGPVGGIYVIEAGSGAPASLRLQVVSDFFFKTEYLSDKDDTRYVGGALSLNVTPVEHLELTAAATMRRVHNAAGASAEDGPETVQSIGDPYFDIKTYGEVGGGVTIGADLLLNLLTAPADDSLDYAGMSAGLRGNVSLDLRRTAARTPLELRLNAGYYFDQSSKVIEQSERDRLNALISGGQTPAVGGNDEYRHLAYRNERLAYNVNRVDHASIAFGLEAPLALSKNVSLHPIAEWELWIPVNRQDYDCPRVDTGTLPTYQGDGCLKQEGASAWPQRVTAGARLYPALAGFSLLAAVEVGINGMNNFVRELAPTAPYRVLLAAAYNFDLAPEKKREPAPVAVPVVPKEGRLHGRVIEKSARTPVAGVQVVVSGTALGGPGTEMRATSDADGQFLTGSLPVGAVQLALEAEGYEPGMCTGAIPVQGGDAGVACELVALPTVGTLLGRVVGVDGAPIAGVTVQLSGPIARSPITAADGSFHELDLPPGEYKARVDNEAYLLSLTSAQVELRKESALQITLVAKPAKPLVKIQKTQLKLSENVYFSTGTADIEARSVPLMTEVADALLRTPAILRLEIQGHTDNVGKPEFNADLAQRRAESVRTWLVGAGVAAERMEAKGYGQKKPIASNKNEKGRAKNRRVAFIITERAAP